MAIEEEDGCLMDPSRLEMRRIGKNGKLGSQRPIREVINNAYLKYMEREGSDYELITDATMRGAFKRVRGVLYGKGKSGLGLPKGTFSYTDIKYEHAGTLSQLRKTLESRLPDLALAHNEWAADGVIQKVLRRDKIYGKKKDTAVAERKMTSTGNGSNDDEEEDKEDEDEELRRDSDEDEIKPDSSQAPIRKRQRDGAQTQEMSRLKKQASQKEAQGRAAQNAAHPINSVAARKKRLSEVLFNKTDDWDEAEDVVEKSNEPNSCPVAGKKRPRAGTKPSSKNGPFKKLLRVARQKKSN